MPGKRGRGSPANIRALTSSKASGSQASNPVYIARVNSVVVRVLGWTNGQYVINWRQYLGAPRTRETFTDFKKAKERAKEIAKAISNSQADVLTLSAVDRETYRAAVLALKPFGISLHAVIDDFTSARAIIPGRTCTEAMQRLKDELDAAAKRAVCPPAAEVVAAMVEDLRTDPHKQRDARELKRLESRLDAVAGAFPDLAAIEHVAAEKFLRGLKKGNGEAVAAKTRDHYLAAAKMLLRYAQRRGWLAKDAAHGFEMICKVFTTKSVVTFSIAEIRAILDACEEKWIPFVVLGAFAGLRTAEIGRLTWDALRWDEKEIVLDMQITKTGHPRNVPMEDNFRAWMLPRAKKVGLIYDYKSEREFEKAVLTFHAAIEDAIEGFHWKDNGLRHSYGSYLYGRERNVATVRANMGNTEEMVMRYYNSPKTKDEATAYFGIKPAAGAANITPMEGGSMIIKRVRDY
jgi:integrase